MDTLLSRLQAPGPKRILSLDGGGIRGCMSLAVLERIETEVVRVKMGPTATLADYFDLIGGTSTGAIIAALLSLGKTVEEVTKSYLDLGPRVFSKPALLARIPWLGPKLFTAWSIEPLEEHARRLFSEKTTLGSPSIRTGLCIVTKRADTFSTWPYINHPEGKFYGENAEIPLWKLIRASAAAPTYFRPVRLEMGKPGQPSYGVFIDGGVSMANNPALQLFLVATLQGFPFHWHAGEHNLLVVSVGTGRWRMKLDQQRVLASENVYWAQNVPELLMQDATEQNELLLQYLSSSPTAREIDIEVGDLTNDLLGGKAQLTYLRYNPVLELEALAATGIQADEKELASLRIMSNGANAKRLYEIGKAFANESIKVGDFPARFDRRPAVGLRGSAAASVTP